MFSWVLLQTDTTLELKIVSTFFEAADYLKVNLKASNDGNWRLRIESRRLSRYLWDWDYNITTSCWLDEETGKSFDLNQFCCNFVDVTEMVTPATTLFGKFHWFSMTGGNTHFFNKKKPTAHIRLQRTFQVRFVTWFSGRQPCLQDSNTLSRPREYTACMHAPTCW